MARPLRIEYDGALYHITARGNERKPIFRDEEDRKIFLDTLTLTSKKYNWICHAYCLMNNHYHLVIETPEGNLSKGMRQVNGVYTQQFNRRHHRVGHIFQGRYKAIVIQKESYLLEVSRYVVLNTVRVKAVKRPEEWRWSSYRGTAGIENPHPCLSVDWILGQFGTKRREAEAKYKEYVEAGIRERGIWKEVRGQSILGEEAFVKRLIRYVRGHKDIKEIPKSMRHIGRPGLREVLKGIDIKDKHQRSPKVIKAVIEHGYSQKEVADYLGIHYSTLSRIVNKGIG